jgi:1-acyl-sn-glycerol-3-phosphate acyltransferase
VLGNHISWLDISLVGGRWNVTFLGKSEIASWPVLGWIVRRAGTLFIERGRGAARAVLDIEAELKGGRSVVLFAEGTTTDGFSVRRFHSRLLQAALETASPVQPMAIRYFDAMGERTRIPSYAGEVTLLQSVWRTVSEPGVVAELTLFDPIPPEEERHLLARHAEGVVRSRVMQGLPRV